MYKNSPTCYCDFFNYAQNEYGHVLKSKATNANGSEEFDRHNPCDELETYWALFFGDHDEWERASLEAIYNNANGLNWANKIGWMNETVHHCKWYGISCDNEGRITSIELRDNNLAGQFPVYTRNYTYPNNGPALESEWILTRYGLANLFKLETIDLAGNKLTGTFDIRPLYNLASLTHFDISENQLSGEIDALVAPSISHSDFSSNNFNSMRRFDKYKGSYQTLRHCDVSNNAIKIKASDRLVNIPPNIERFFAQNNQIYGSLSESLNYLPRLRQFDVSSNALSGQLPDFGESFLTLQKLDLSNQAIGFTGSIPADLAKYLFLKVLNVADNKITGTVPPFIGNMAVLEVLDLSNNSLKNRFLQSLESLEVSNYCVSHLSASDVSDVLTFRTCFVIYPQVS